MKYYGRLEDAEDWAGFLDDPRRQWADKDAAGKLARAWGGCRRFPEAVHKALVAASLDLVPLFGFPGYRVSLPGGREPSENDLYVLARDGKDNLFPVMVEGMTDGNRGPLMGDWNRDSAPEGLDRFNFLAGELDLEGKGIGVLRYRLVHRAVSVLMEGSRLGTDRGMLLAHSFGDSGESFEDYRRFLSAFCLEAERERVRGPIDLNGFSLYFGWVQEASSGVVEN